MKKNRLIFFAIFAVYHLIIFIFSLYIKFKQSDPLALYPLLSYVSIFIFGSIMGLVLLIADFIWSWKSGRDNANTEEAMRLENNTLKAKIYDLQEGKKLLRLLRLQPVNMDFKALIKAELEQASHVLENFIANADNIQRVENAANLFADAIKGGRKAISCGNGGSHCDAMHFAEELTGRYRDNRRALPAICVSDVSHLTCVANDYGFDYVFSRYVEALGNAGDVLLAISTSGNSPNVLKAAEAAKAKGMKVVALTGKDGGSLAALADVEIRVAHLGFADRIQEVHIKVIHILILLIEKAVI